MVKDVNISDLTLKAKFGASILLYVRTKELHLNNPTTLMYNLTFKTFHIGKLQIYLNLVSFEEVNSFDENLQNDYRNQIYRLIPKEKLVDSVNSFGQVV